MLRELLIDNPTLDLLKRGLDATVLRHRVIADNIANAATPGHTSRKVEFESLFRAAVEQKLDGTRTHPRHRPVGGGSGPVLPEPRVLEVPPEARQSGLEADMVALIENSSKHTALLKLLGGTYQGLVTAIRGRPPGA